MNNRPSSDLAGDAAAPAATTTAAADPPALASALVSAAPAAPADVRSAEAAPSPASASASSTPLPSTGCDAGDAVQDGADGADGAEQAAGPAAASAPSSPASAAALAATTTTTNTALNGPASPPPQPPSTRTSLQANNAFGRASSSARTQSASAAAPAARPYAPSALAPLPGTSSTVPRFSTGLAANGSNADLASSDAYSDDGSVTGAAAAAALQIGSGASDLAVSLPREIDDIQIVLTNNCLCFRGVQSPLNNDRIALEGHVFVLFGAAPPRNLRAVRVRAVGEEQVSAKSTQMASPKRLRGIFEHRTILDLSAVIWEPTLDELEGVRSRELPFSLEIPGDVCPASVSAEEGTISYHLEVLLEMARDSQADTDTSSINTAASAAAKGGLFSITGSRLVGSSRSINHDDHLDDAVHVDNAVASAQRDSISSNVSAGAGQSHVQGSKADLVHHHQQHHQQQHQPSGTHDGDDVTSPTIMITDTTITNSSFSSKASSQHDGSTPSPSTPTSPGPAASDAASTSSFSMRMPRSRFRMGSSTSTGSANSPSTSSAMGLIRGFGFGPSSSSTSRRSSGDGTIVAPHATAPHTLHHSASSINDSHNSANPATPPSSMSIGASGATRTSRRNSSVGSFTSFRNAASSPTPTTRSSIKSPSLLTLLGAVADFRVQRLPTISEMKNPMEPFATSTAHVSCVTTGSRLLLAHEAAAGVYMSVSPCRVSLQIISSAGPYQINKIVASLVEQTVFTGRKRSLVTKMQKNSTKSYTRTRDVLGEREIGGDAVGTLVVLDLCDLSAATSLNQDALSTHVAVTHHLALDVHCDKQEGSLQLRIPILVAFS